MMNDANGCSMCREPGEERWEPFFSSVFDIKAYNIQYDYRARNGRLFSCVKPTLEDCRTARDAWLKQNGLEG